MNEPPFFTISLNLDYIYNKLHKMKLDKCEKIKSKNSINQQKIMLDKRKVLENGNSIKMKIKCYIEPKNRTTLRSIQFTINGYKIYQLTMNDKLGNFTHVLSPVK